MYISELISAPVYVGNTHRGNCVGIGISLKSQKIKCILGNSQATLKPFFFDFAVSVTNVQNIENRKIQLTQLRLANTQTCAKIFLGLPVYAYDGGFLGNLQDVSFDENYRLLKFFTDQGFSCPAMQLFACSDALILRKESPFPVGQRIPAPHLFRFLDKPTTIVTKKTLRQAVENGSLISLTLSLEPFRFSN